MSATHANAPDQQADIDDIDILVGVLGTKSERAAWARLRVLLMKTPEQSA